MKNVFNPEHVEELVNRIEMLSPSTKPLWGKMSVNQMLAHCNVSYEFVYDAKHKKPGAIKKWLLKTFVKQAVVGEKPYKKSTPTAPEFLIKDERDFSHEKQRLISYLKRTLELGESYFNGRESHSFGPLTVREWNIMFYKHLDHHLTQFGV